MSGHPPIKGDLIRAAKIENLNNKVIVNQVKRVTANQGAKRDRKIILIKKNLKIIIKLPNHLIKMNFQKLILMLLIIATEDK